jgi:hypothetical protein
MTINATTTNKTTVYATTTNKTTVYATTTNTAALNAEDSLLPPQMESKQLPPNRMTEELIQFSRGLGLGSSLRYDE